MNIQLTNEASNRLSILANNQDVIFKLVYDADGCGCAVSGVPALWMLDADDEELQHPVASKEPLPIIYEQRQEVFFEEHLKLDYRADRQSFVLSSSGQIYTNDLAIRDKR